MEDPNAILTELLNQANVKLYERNWPELHQLFEQMYLLALDEERRKLRDGRANLAAETAVQDGQWQWGRQLYQLALNDVPGHRGASKGLREIEELERVDEEMRRLIEAGDSAFAAGDYRQAIDRFKDAKNQTEKARILKYHASLDQKINQALELRSWQERVQETVASAKRLHKGGELTQALAELQRLQAELPEEPLYADMAQEINALVNQIKQETDADQVLSEAIKRYREEDYEGALELVDTPALASNEEAKRLKQRCQDQLDRFIYPTLDRAEQALLRGQWQDAFAELQELRKEYPRNPNSKRLWLRVGRKAGEQALELGREANSERNFQEATALFERASQAFGRVLEVYPDHPAITALRDEAVDLAYIANNEHQAQKLWRQGERKAALTHLDNASGRISSAHEQGRDYVAVGSVVEAMVKEINDQLKSIAEDERRLENGQRQLGNKQFDSAAESFRQALNALSAEHRQRARDGLDRAEAAIRDYDASMVKAKASADPEARVRHLEDAYRLWPTGPQAVELLATACLGAAEAALKDGRAQDAAAFANRALDLDPKNRAAEAIRDRIDNEPKILADLAGARSELALLRDGADASAERYAALASQLQETANRARPYPDLKKQADALAKEARAEQARWGQLESHLAQATQSMRAGRWDEGVDLLARGVKALGDEAPEPLAARLQAWQGALQQQMEIEAQLADLWRQAEQSYQAGPESGDFAATLKTLDQIEARLSAVESTAAAIEAALPASQVSWQQQFKDLRERAEIARDAAAQRSAAQGLLILRQARRKWPTDTTLQTLDARLSVQARDDVKALLRQAQLDLEAGETATAVEKLAQAYELQPDNEEIATQYGSVQKRKKLEDKLRDVQTVAAAKLDGNSKVAAADALKNGIQILLREGDLSEAVRDALGSLLSKSELTVNGRTGEAFADNDVWKQVWELRGDLDTRASERWADAQASVLASQWAELTRDQHLHRSQTTAADVGMYFRAWQAARDAMMRQPGDLELQALVAERLAQFIKQCEAAAAKRIKNARGFLDKGDFGLAKEELASLQNVIGPALDISPNFFEANQAVAVLAELEKVQELEQEIDAQAAVAEKATPLLEKAEEAYVAGRYEEVSRNLRAVPDLAPVPRLAAQRDDLQRRLRQARVAQAEKTLSDALLAATSALGLAASTDDLQRTASELRAVGEAREFDWTILPGDAISRYDEILRKIDKRKGDFGSFARYQESADAKEGAGQFEETKRLLAQAKELTADRSEQAEIDLRLQDITKLAQLEADAHELLEKGEDKLSEAEPAYQDVLTLFGAAQNRFNSLQQEIKQSLKGDRAGTASDAVRAQEERIAALIDLAQAGVALSRAETHRHRPDTWTAARYEFEDALELAAEASKSSDGSVKAKAKIIERRAKRLLEQMDQEQATRAKLQVELDAVQAWLVAGNLDAAGKKLDELTLEYKMGFSEQIELVKARYLEILSATEQIKKARGEMEAGNFSAALATVDIVLAKVPKFEDALILKQQIEQGAEANKRLQEALSFARKEDFQKARNALQQAVESGVDEARKKKVEDQVGALEKAAKNRAVEPIRTSIKVSKYRKALDDCGKALQRLASSGFKEEIEALQAEALEKWINSELRDRARSDTDQRLDDLLETLELYAKRTPPLGEPQHRALLGLQREAQTRQLRAQLAQARSLVENTPPNWDEARKRINSVTDQAGEHGLGGVQKDAVSLGYEIDDLERTWGKQQAQSKRDTWIKEAQDCWNSAAGPDDYRAVQVLAQQVLALDGFKADREARQWQQDATRELEAYQRTEQSMAEASNLVRQRHFEEARSALQIAPVAVLLQEQHQRQRQMVDVLVDADHAELAADWQAAFDGYRNVLEMDRNLEAVLRVDIDRCRSKLMDAVLEQVQTALAVVPPNTQRATQLLDQAETGDLVGDADRQVVRRLRTRISGLAQVAQAAVILAEPSGDAGEALRMLAAARDILPADEADRLVRDWEHLAVALQGWQRGDIIAAQRAVKAIQPPVSTLERVTQLADDLDEAVRRSQRIEQTRNQVQAALHKDPPAFAEAVAIVTPLAREMPDPQAEDLHALVRRSLMERVEHERQRDNYQAALDLQPLLEQLDPASSEIRSLAETLSAEREQRLQEAIGNTLAALESNDLTQARHAYQRATVIAAPAGDGRLAPVAQRIADYEEQLQRIGELIAGAAQARRSGRWEEVVNLLEQARDVAPRQKQVQESCLDTQRQLADLAEEDLRASRFESAAARVSLGRRLGASPDLQALAERIESARQAHVGQRRELWSAALDRWDLVTAETLATELQDAIGGDIKLKQLRDRYLSMKEASNEIVQAMRRGWTALDRRDFPKARSAFEQANGLVNPSGFAEAGAWLSYMANLETVQEPVAEGRWRDMGGVQDALRRAKASVAVGDPATLPAILPETNAKRQKAAGVAAELERILSLLTHWYERYQAYARQLKMDDAIDALNQVGHFQQEFLRQFDDASPPSTASVDSAGERTAARSTDRTDSRPTPAASAQQDQAPKKMQTKSTAASTPPDVSASSATPAQAAVKPPKGAHETADSAAKPAAKAPSEPAVPSVAEERVAPDAIPDETSPPVAAPKKRNSAPQPVAEASGAEDGKISETAEEQGSPDLAEEQSDTASAMVWDMTGFSLPSYDDKE